VQPAAVRRCHHRCITNVPRIRRFESGHRRAMHQLRATWAGPVDPRRKRVVTRLALLFGLDGIGGPLEFGADRVLVFRHTAPPRPTLPCCSLRPRVDCRLPRPSSVACGTNRPVEHDGLDAPAIQPVSHRGADVTSCGHRGSVVPRGEALVEMDVPSASRRAPPRREVRDERRVHARRVHRLADVQRVRRRAAGAWRSARLPPLRRLALARRPRAPVGGRSALATIRMTTSNAAWFSGSTHLLVSFLLFSKRSCF
jgi:hypothetical protein